MLSSLMDEFKTVLHFSLVTNFVVALWNKDVVLCVWRQMTP